MVGGAPAYNQENAARRRAVAAGRGRLPWRHLMLRNRVTLPERPADRPLAAPRRATLLWLAIAALVAVDLLGLLLDRVATIGP
jgi:hypothetical protein